jgi:DNA-binding IclR family transcriptional regulator
MLALARSGAPSKTLREKAVPHLVALAERTEETIHFSVSDRDVQMVPDRAARRAPIAAGSSAGRAARAVLASIIGSSSTSPQTFL